MASPTGLSSGQPVKDSKHSTTSESGGNSFPVHSFVFSLSRFRVSCYLLILGFKSMIESIVWSVLHLSLVLQATGLVLSVV